MICMIDHSVDVVSVSSRALMVGYGSRKPEARVSVVAGLNPRLWISAGRRLLDAGKELFRKVRLITVGWEHVIYAQVAASSCDWRC